MATVTIWATRTRGAALACAPNSTNRAMDLDSMTDQGDISQSGSLQETGKVRRAPMVDGVFNNQGETNAMRHTIALLLTVALAGCDDSIAHTTDGAADAPLTTDASPDQLPDRAPVDGDTGAMLRIYIRGDTTPRTFTDGYAGQTPSLYHMGLGRFDIMTSATAAPVTVFDHGANPVEVDMLGKTLGGQAALASLPSGTYTHGRVLLTMTTFTVKATVHLGGAVAGDLAVTVALSDTTVGGTAWSKGKASFTFAQQTLPATVPPLPSTGGGMIVEEPGKTWLVFPFPTPLQVSAAAQDQSATIVYDVFESFRWQDQTTAGYSPNVFDVDPLALSWEQLKNFGATGYSVEIN